MDECAQRGNAIMRVKDKPSGLSPEQIEAIKQKELKRLAKQEAAKKARAEARASVAGQIIVPPKPFTPGVSGNPSGRAKYKYVRGAMEKVIAKARVLKHDDPDVGTRLEALLVKIYTMAMESDKLAEVLEAAKYVSERLDGKPSADVDEGSGGHGPLIVNIGTRFSVTPQREHVEAITVSNG